MDRDVVCIETKGPKDNLDRLADQMREFRMYVPEVWLAVHSKWANDVRREANLLVVDAEGVTTPHARDKPDRDELAVMRLLELLWTDELVAIAQRQNIAGGPIHGQLKSKNKLRKLCARLLTGNEILTEVCRELRSRPLAGIGSDGALSKRLPTATAAR